MTRHRLMRGTNEANCHYFRTFWLNINDSCREFDQFGMVRGKWMRSLQWPDRTAFKICMLVCNSVSFNPISLCKTANMESPFLSFTLSNELFYNGTLNRKVCVFWQHWPMLQLRQLLYWNCVTAKTRINSAKKLITSYALQLQLNFI